MKLKNKLIPIATIGAVVATIAPISITSCAKNTNGGFIDLNNGYKSTIEMYTGRDVFVDEYEPTTIYSEEAQKNPEIFTNDWLWSTSKSMQEIKDTWKQLYHQNTPAANAERAKFPTDELLNQYKNLSPAELDKVIADNAKKAEAAAPAQEARAEYGSLGQYIGTVGSHKVKFSDVVVKSTRTTIAYSDTAVPLISFTIEFDTQYTYDDVIDLYEYSVSKDAKEQQQQKRFASTATNESTELGILALNQKGTIKVENVPFKVENVPFVVSYATDLEDRPIWYVKPSNELMWYEQKVYDLKKNPWSVSVNMESTKVSATSYEGIGTTKLTSKTSTVASYSYEDTLEDTWDMYKQEELSTYLKEYNIRSYYFWKVGIRE